MIYLSNQATPGSYNIWTAIEKTAHRQRRRLVGSVVNDRSMRIFEPTINEQVDIFIKQIALNMERPLDLKDRINYLSMDIIGLLSFGFDLRSQTQEKYRYFSDDMPDANSRLNIYMQVPAIARYRLFVPLDMLWHKAQEKMYGLIEFMIKSRMAKAQNAKYDLYSVISDALTTEEGEGLRVNDLWMEAIFFIVAGSSPVTHSCGVFFARYFHSLISNFFFYLGRRGHDIYRYSGDLFLRGAAPGMLQEASRGDTVYVQQRRRHLRQQADGLPLSPSMHRRGDAHVSTHTFDPLAAARPGIRGEGCAGR